MAVTSEPSQAFEERVHRVLAAHGVGQDALEASVRGGPGVAVTGRRMMVEGLAPEVAAAVVDAVIPDSSTRKEARALLTVAMGHALPLIAGWDDASTRVAKLYLNASDAARSVRRDAARALGHGDVEPPPHVIGVNIAADARVETKVYHQHEALPGNAPAPLAGWAAGLSLGGIVESRQVSPEPARTKAWFIAPLKPDGEAMVPHLERLPGWDTAAVAAALPFAPGVIKSVGWSTLPGDDRWTVYVKPRGAAATTWRLDPSVCVATDDCEVAVFLEPTDAPRVYHRGRDHALSYRVRRGTTRPDQVEPLMAWAIAVLDAHERRGWPLTFASPPKPWHVVESRDR